MVFKIKIFLVTILIFLFAVSVDSNNSICGSVVKSDLKLDDDLFCGEVEGPVINLTSGVTLDCQGHKIVSNSDFGIVYSLGTRNIAVKNCIIEGDSYVGLRFDSIDGLSAENNTVYGFTKGIYIEGGSISSSVSNKNLFIRGNRFIYARDSGIDFEIGGGLSHNNVSIIENDVSNSDIGLSIHHVRGLFLEDNILSNNRIGLYVSRGTYNLNGIRIENPKEIGLSVANIVDSVFKDIQISGNGDIGVFVDTEVVWNLNTNNVFDRIISNGKRIGMLVKGEFSNNTIKNNDFSNSYGYGIKTQISGNTKQESNSYYNNDLSNSGTAIEIAGNNLISLDTNNKFLNSNLGLSIERGSYLKVNDLDLSSVKAVPIQINGCVDCIFKNIDASGTSGIGLQIISSGYTNNRINVEDVNFSGREKGVLIYGGKNIVVRNSFFHGNLDCIDIKSSWNRKSEGVLIESNQFYNCESHGIKANYLYDSVVTRNKIIGSKSAGILLGDDDTSGNRIFENLFDGNGVGVLILSGHLNKVYKNKFLNSKLLHASSILENYFSENVSGIMEGNCWDGSEGIDIIDINKDGYGDSGNNYPYNKANGGLVSNNVEDYGPMMECITLDSDKDWILDKDDFCPGTGDNKLVEEHGCNCEQIKQLFFEKQTNKKNEVPIGNGICQVLGINPKTPQGSGPGASGFIKVIKKF